MFCIPLTVWIPTDEARDFAQAVTRALDRSYTRKDAAERMGISVPRLSEWLAAVKPMQAFRLTALGSDFWDALLEELAEQRGGYYLKPDVVMLLHGAAVLRRPPLAMKSLARKQKASA